MKITGITVEIDGAIKQISLEQARAFHAQMSEFFSKADELPVVNPTKPVYNPAVTMSSDSHQHHDVGSGLPDAQSYNEQVPDI